LVFVVLKILMYFWWGSNGVISNNKKGTVKAEP
jgi:hypothetical protein